MAGMLKIVPIVEGQGEVAAVPPLLFNILHNRMQRYDVLVETPINAKGIHNLTKPDGLERFLDLAFVIPRAGAVLVMLDADNDCPIEKSQTLITRVIAAKPRLPVAVVLPCRAFETWFLASAETISGPLVDRAGLYADLIAPIPPESVPNPKRWLMDNMDKAENYKETPDQEILTRRIDLELAASRSRSFQRLLHAVDELLAAIDNGVNSVTPHPTP